VTTAVAKGDLSKKIHGDVKGEILELKSTINTMVDQLGGFASEVSAGGARGGHRGKLGGQAQVPGAAGTWKDLTDNVNSMAANLTGQVRNIAEVTTAVAKGDLSKKITVDVEGRDPGAEEHDHTMVDQLNGFASECRGCAPRWAPTASSWPGAGAWMADLEGPHRQRQRRWRRSLHGHGAQHPRGAHWPVQSAPMSQ